MGILSYLSGRLGLTVNPKTGQRVRLRSVASDDWGNTMDVVEEYNPHSGSWERKGDVEGSISGGHY
jgi:hypothetical protein